MTRMVLGSHNSWSYLPVKKWWMRPLAFMARCQCKTIQEQYKLGVRCFDLRVRFDEEWNTVFAHGIIEYNVSEYRVWKDLRWLDDKGDCYVRVIHEARSKKQHSEYKTSNFQYMCRELQKRLSNTKFWCGRNLYNWEVDYDFGFCPTCEEKYASVSCKWLAWWPWLYARAINHRIRTQGSNSDILLIDYVNIK